ncbi:MAG: hypothetical protein IKF82_00490 [Bacilli bacterium]|nr:hypothetical protein [Bacilli bacterium]
MICINEERFRYHSRVKTIYDSLTGEQYDGNKKTCNLLNAMDDRCNRNAEKYFEYKDVCDKHSINSAHKLDLVLFWRVFW